MTIVSGIQPSGKLHVGNYLGAVRNWLALQGNTPSSSPSIPRIISGPSGRGEKNECFFFIADWHSLTEEYEPKEKAAQVRELAAELLALDIGVDRPNVVLFRQSDLSEHLELAWYLGCQTPVGSMERMTQYKDKLEHGESPSIGLFTYPVLMAADILAYSQNVELKNGRTEEQKNSGVGVPVGDDQKQHLELANDIVRRFNNRFGPTFPEIQYLPAPVARVMSLKDPMKKMSKSLGGDHCLFLDDSPEEITRKLKAAVTDTVPTQSHDSRLTAHDSISPGVRTLFEILEAFGTKAEVARFRKAHDAGTIKYSELKPAVAKAFTNAHAEFRIRKAELMAHPDRIDAALTAGAKTARAVASATLAAVRERVGVR